MGTDQRIPVTSGNPTFDGDVTFEGNVTFKGGVLFGNTYKTGILTGDQTDLLIPEVEKYTILRFTSDRNIDIDSIVAPPVPDDIEVTERVFVFVNGNNADTDNYWIRLTDTSPSPTPENHFDMPADLQIRPGDMWWIKYSYELVGGILVPRRWGAQAKL